MSFWGFLAFVFAAMALSEAAEVWARSWKDVQIARSESSIKETPK